MQRIPFNLFLIIVVATLLSWKRRYKSKNKKKKNYLGEKGK